jgi:hypothetical protein
MIVEFYAQMEDKFLPIGCGETVDGKTKILSGESHEFMLLCYSIFFSSKNKYN